MTTQMTVPQAQILENEYKKLIEDNHNLIYSFLNKHHLPSDSGIVDWYGACAEGLCHAALIYDKNRNLDFSTLAYKSMWLFCGKEMRRLSNKLTSLSLDKNKVNEDVSLISILCDSNRVHYDIEYKDFLNVLETIISNFNTQDQGIIEQRLYGKSFREIGEKYNISKQRVQQKYSKFVNCVKSFMNTQERVLNNSN